MKLHDAMQLSTNIAQIRTVRHESIVTNIQHISIHKLLLLIPIYTMNAFTSKPFENARKTAAILKQRRQNFRSASAVLANNIYYFFFIQHLPSANLKSV